MGLSRTLPSDAFRSCLLSILLTDARSARPGAKRKMAAGMGTGVSLDAARKPWMPPHYTELAETLGLQPEEARQVQRKAAESVPGCWFVKDTDYVESWAPFSNVPTHYLVTIEGPKSGTASEDSKCWPCAVSFPVPKFVSTLVAWIAGSPFLSACGTRISSKSGQRRPYERPLRQGLEERSTLGSGLKLHESLPVGRAREELVAV